MKTPATQFEREVIANIPLAAAMQIHVAEYTGTRLVLAAPFAPSRNHTGIAFGGAIECLGALACWGLVWLTLDDPAAQIVISDAHTEFRAPIRSELRATANAPSAEAWDRFTREFARHARARVGLSAAIGDARGCECASFYGRFAALRR